MNLSEPFIQRPIATSLLMAAIALFGTVAYRALPVSDLPNVDFPTLQVTASLPGASPETMASAVATPLENQFSTIAGLIAMTSVNSLGAAQITLEFDLNRSLDGAAVDTQAAITQASKLLPNNMPTPPTFTKVNPADQPIIFVALTSKMVPLYTLDEYAETRLAQRISTISGVAQVQVLGAQKYAVHVQMDPHEMASHQVGINEVETALQNWNVNLPTGQITGPQRAFTLQASGQLMSAAEYKTLIVAYRNGNPVRLSDIGVIKDSVEDDKTASWYYEGDKDGQRAIVLGIQRQPGTNTIEVTDNIKKLLPSFKSELPPSVDMSILYDRSDTIRESYNDVEFTMLLTLGLVIAVIFAVPAQRLRHRDSQSGAAVLDRRNVLGDVPVALQPGQPVDDGADSVGGLRGGRRHRDARKHFPAHGNGQEAAGGFAGGLERNRVHHRVDDAVAGGGVHSGAVHGRASWDACSASSR